LGARRLVIVGTGTGVGKTHVACTLLETRAELGFEAIGLKPIETGVVGGAGEKTDQERLWEASQAFHVKQRTPPTFHVKRALYTWPDPVSPHLAARRSGAQIDLTAVRHWALDHAAPLTILETAGGLFSPLGPSLTNFDLVRALAPAAVLLVAPDRLGVLHDLTATLGWASARGLTLSAVALSAPEHPDASTGHNASELALLDIAHPLTVFPRAPTTAPESRAAAGTILRWLEASSVADAGV
jgi:dethiobiotin synthetase